ncbi:hypothetical protein B0H17DRAFT_1205945 [Mycena rosella]|uniref:Uncharacterized protein n=1 Tax=Mycena rosella TaxID=1033263 RepID=A0AAD7GDF7_MYCRO|nr:hypothetical protein B0H17DRAFT_1205945 [Mycena rosella]
MNVAAQQYATAIMNELRGWAHEWLAALRASREQQRMLGLPAPHPNHLLPPGSPSAILTWRGGSSGSTFTARSKFGTSTASRSIELGVFEIAGAIYDDAARPFAINADLVLEAMLASLSARAPVRLASRHGLVPNAQPGAPPHAVQVYELRTPGGEVIRQVGLRRLS